MVKSNKLGAVAFVIVVLLGLSALLAICHHSPGDAVCANHGGVVYRSPDKQLVTCFGGETFVEINGTWHQTNG